MEHWQVWKNNRGFILCFRLRFLRKSAHFAEFFKIFGHSSADIYLFKVSKRNTLKRCKICSKLTIKTPKRCHWRRSGVFITIFEYISHLSLLSLLLTLNKYMLAMILLNPSTCCLVVEKGRSTCKAFYSLCLE